MLAKERGISIIVLILIVILLIIGIRFAIYKADKMIKETELEDLKTTMLAIHGRAKTVKDRVKKVEDTEYIGEKIKDVNEYNYLQNDKGRYYKLNHDHLEQMGVVGIQTTEEEFYIVDYDTCEVYYSLGYEGKYTLTDIQNIIINEDGNAEENTAKNEENNK